LGCGIREYLHQERAGGDKEDPQEIAKKKQNDDEIGTGGNKEGTPEEIWQKNTQKRNEYVN